MMRNLTTLLFLLFLSFSAIAQDKIIKKSGDIINCKVTEIAADEVKYYYTENPKLVFGIDKAKLEKIVFGTGEVIEIKSDTFMDTDYYANQSKHALKISFLSPIFGHTEFSYEQFIKPGKSWETAIGIIGLGIDNYGIDAKGVYTKFAYKMMRKPDYYTQRMHYSHILKGAYIAPELALRYVTYNSNNYTYEYSNNYRVEDYGFALTIKFGKQWVFDDGLLIDLYLGIGYGIGGGTHQDELIPFGFTAGTSQVPLAITSGLRIGWVF